MTNDPWFKAQHLISARFCNVLPLENFINLTSVEAATWLGHQGERQDRRLWLPGGLGVLHWRSSPSLCKIRKPCFFVCLYHLCLYLNHSQSICDYVSIYIITNHYIDLLFQSKEQFPLTGVRFACCFKWCYDREMGTQVNLMGIGLHSYGFFLKWNRDLPWPALLMAASREIALLLGVRCINSNPE